MSIIINGILAGSGGGSGGGGIAEAPADGKIYGRQNAAWSAVESARHRHVQAAAAVKWPIQHNLGQKPVAVWTYDAAGGQIFGEPDFVGSTLNYLEINFSQAVSGTAYISTLL